MQIYRYRDDSVLYVDMMGVTVTGIVWCMWGQMSYRNGYSVLYVDLMSYSYRYSVVYVDLM